MHGNNYDSTASKNHIDSLKDQQQHLDNTLTFNHRDLQESQRNVKQVEADNIGHNKM